ncbi:MAG TPA: cation:proton antiporter [Patescibacteria group bacterium]|nr:cation:proton antiporter [Patescibacteria group bacterium]
MADNIFLQISVLLGITVTIAFFMRLLKQPLVVAYIIAGLVAGPFFLGLAEGQEDFFETFARFGIVLLLFIVGLSLNFNHFRRLGRSVIIGGLAHFFIVVGLGLALLLVYDFSLLSAFFLSVAVSFSSTIIIVKILSDKRDLETVHGRYLVGILLLQDLVAVLILVFLNSANTNENNLFAALLTFFGRGLLLFGFIVFISRYVLPLIVERMAKSGEMLFIFTIAWCFGVASLVYWVGFSLEIGAIAAGISLGASVYQPEISSRVRPLRDFFLVIFFIVLGSELQLGQISAIIKPALALSLFVLIVDPLVLFLLMRRLKYTRRSSFLAGLASIPVSEFGFILIFKARDFGYLRGEELAVLTFVALFSMVVSSYLITYGEKIYFWLLPFLTRMGRDKENKNQLNIGEYTVWVFGYHRMGWKICEALAERRIKFAVVDYNPEAVARLKQRNIPAFFGDAADVEFLSTLPLEKSRLIISTLPEPDDQKTLILHVRNLSDRPIIVGNLYHNLYLDDLYEAGANYVMMPHLLGGQWMADILKNHDWTKSVFSRLRQTQKEEMRLRYTMGTHN